MTDVTVTQADERAADEWYPDRSATMHRKLAKLLARHRTAHSGEGRSNGAGEDVDAIFAAALEELDRECRCAAVRGEDGKRVGVAVLRKHFGPAMLLSRDEFAPLTNSALRAQVAALSAPQGEVERLREALVEHFPTGIRGLYEQSAQRIPVQTHVGTNCLCGWCTSATDEHEVRDEWAAHVAAALAQPEGTKSD